MKTGKNMQKSSPSIKSVSSTPKMKKKTSQYLFSLQRYRIKTMKFYAILGDFSFFSHKNNNWHLTFPLKVIIMI